MNSVLNKLINRNPDSRDAGLFTGWLAGDVRPFTAQEFNNSWVKKNTPGLSYEKYLSHVSRLR
jgi:hypothetical protein